jgi:hypothetical protein
MPKKEIWGVSTGAIATQFFKSNALFDLIRDGKAGIPAPALLSL